ncbi:hypothetical protein WR25_20356 [Diploscapter pachys]|uniref:Uncharacterized protein n=1 Tax=Diploscapter pachys TaxID=2018661 RepID=A0A2A2J0V2_9BILA|nr:hypothetical protein WR25_20356 [Diploscapter pachys]
MSEAMDNADELEPIEDILEIPDNENGKSESERIVTPPQQKDQRTPPRSNNLNDDILLPVSPAKRFSTMVEGSSREPPHSPDTRFARHRLGALLTSIKQGDNATIGQDSEQRQFIEDLTSPSKKGPGRPKKLGKEKQVVFELRGKPFGLEDGRAATEYQLCRAWMRGKSEDVPLPKPLEMPPLEIPVELLATRDVYTLPPPSGEYPVEEAWPKTQLDKLDSDVNPEDMDNLKAEYARHWKSIKKQWRTHMRNRSMRYGNSIQLLDLIFQNTQNAAPAQ